MRIHMKQDVLEKLLRHYVPDANKVLKATFNTKFTVKVREVIELGVHWWDFLNLQNYPK